VECFSTHNERTNSTLSRAVGLALRAVGLGNATGGWRCKPREILIAFFQLGVILRVFEAVDANIPASWACSRKGRWHLSRLAKLEQRKSKL
jgi:hypothetical protein